MMVVKARVNDLAKELEKTNKEGSEILQNNNEEIKNSPAADGQAAPAKKKITAVYRPQNRAQKSRPTG